ncbi:hypothetical protein APHAL10511_008422 [Amanita phalloides]|nr:hypothetical protein APHAL10511_008422 [Amanita phalloides]
MSTTLPIPHHLSSPPIVALTSQHHHSDYNCLKFGPTSAPAHYSLLSLHTPGVFTTLLLCQACTQHIQVWWLAQPPLQPPPPVPSFSTTGPWPDDLTTLQPSIHAALLKPLHASLALTCSVKTSVSHPFNISPIIPPDLIAIISSRLAPTHCPGSPWLAPPCSNSLCAASPPPRSLAASTSAISPLCTCTLCPGKSRLHSDALPAPPGLRQPALFPLPAPGSLLRFTPSHSLAAPTDSAWPQQPLVHANPLPVPPTSFQPASSHPLHSLPSLHRFAPSLLSGSFHWCRFVPSCSLAPTWQPVSFHLLPTP